MAVESLAAEPKTNAEASTETIVTTDEQPIKESELGSQELSSAGSSVDNAATCEAGAESAISDAADSHDFLTQLRAKYPQAKPIHPKAIRMPAISKKQFRAMVEDIRKHGQALAIILVEGMLLDGMTRELACFEAGVLPWYQDWKGNDDPEELSLSLNVRRRQLTPSQLAVYAADDVLEEEAASANLQKPKCRTQMKEEAAEKKGVSLRLVDDAIKVKKEAPEELEKVRAGKKKLYEAVAELKSKQKPKPALQAKSTGVVAEEAPIITATELMSPASAPDPELVSGLKSMDDHIESLNRYLARLDEAECRTELEKLMSWVQAKLQSVSDA